MFELIISVPDKSASPPELGRQVHEWYDNSGNTCAYAYRLGARYWLRFPGLARYGFELGDNQITGVPEGEADLDAVEDTFVRSVIPLALHAHGHEALHASAVSTPGGILVLCAVSGTGKSTLAFALSRRGYGLWADDAVVFSVDGSVAAAIPLPFISRIHGPAVAHFGINPGRRYPPWEFPEGAVSPAQTLSTICVLERDAACTVPGAVERLTAVKAFPLLLTHAYCFSLEDPERKEAMLRHYLEVASGIPIYRLRFVPGLGHLAQLQDALEALIRTGEPAT